MALQCRNNKCGNRRALMLYPNGCCPLCFPKSIEGRRIKRNAIRKKRKEARS